MKKPDPMRGMIYICTKCKTEMPIDEEKSKNGEQYHKRKCKCGSGGRMKFIG
jgi:DNA-directed RNA polymerase subunit RPC12/RpoP